MLSLRLPLLFVVVLILLLPSCRKATSSNEVQQNKIETVFTVIYNNFNKTTSATARFSVYNLANTGQFLELSNNATILFDGNPMIWNSESRKYEWNSPVGNGLSSGTFSYTNNNGETYLNTVTAYPITLPTDLDTIPKDSAYDLTWVGDVSQVNQLFVYATETADYTQEKSLGAYYRAVPYNDAVSITIPQHDLAATTANSLYFWIENQDRTSLLQNASGEGMLMGVYIDGKGVRVK
ncbi:MAG: hypothetical protein ACRBFS_17325 [Aureispira sp.]